MSALNSPWTCSLCKRHIAPGDGYVVLMSETFGYPKKDKPLLFDVLHGDCDQHPATEPYWIAVERAETLEAWARWVHHVGSKQWMTTDDLTRMIALWFENRGLSVHAQM